MGLIRRKYTPGNFGVYNPGLNEKMVTIDHFLCGENTEEDRP
jgi:hypothetical protein